MTQVTTLIKLRMDCKHLVETRVFYDNYVKSKHDMWIGRLTYCQQCKRIRKVIRVEGGGQASK